MKTILTWMLRHARWMNALMVVILLASSQSGAGTARASASPAGDIWVNFTFTPDFPLSWQEGLQSCLNAVLPAPASRTEYILSSYRYSQDLAWLNAVAVPRAVVDSGWEVDDLDAQLAQVLVHQDTAGQFPCTLVSRQGDPELLRQAPADLGDYSFFYQPSLQSLQGLDFRFPWIAGLVWTLKWGWHGVYSLDFAPQSNSNPSTNMAVLAAEGGNLSIACGAPSDLEQNILKIVHSDGSVTKYFHLAANSIPGDLIGKTIPRGTFLGVLYDGRVKNYPYPSDECGKDGCVYSTVCGYGSGAHLHFNVSNPDLVVQGKKLSDIAGSGGSKFTSTNDPGENSQPSSCGGGEGVVVYSGKNFTGTCVRLTQNVSDLVTTAIGRNQLESLKIFGNYQVTLYNDAGFGGDSSTFTTDDKDLSDNKIGANRASAAKVSRRGLDGSSNPTPNCDGGAGVYLYSEKNYGGSCFKVTGEISDLSKTLILENTVSSVRIVGGYEARIYSKKRFAGDKSTFLGDDPDLSNNTVGDNTASSVKATQKGSNPTSNCTSGPGVYLYENVNYSGRCSLFIADSANPKDWYVGNNSAGSLRIVGDMEADACENDNFQGTCSHFTQSVPDLSQTSVGADQISSLRVRVSAGAQPVACAAGQFRGEYFANARLEGSPVLVRCENQIDFNWLFGPPAWNLPWDNFSSRYDGEILVNTSGLYNIQSTTDDGVRVWLDGKLIIGRWNDMAATPISVRRNLTAGLHTVRMEYYEHSGVARASLSWGLSALAEETDDSMREMELGDALNGAISTSGEADAYFFDGVHGQAVTIYMEKSESSLDSLLAVYDQDGRLVGQADDNQGSPDALLNLNLPGNGRYTIEARGYGSSTGGYRLLLTAETLLDGDDSRWVALGSETTGTLGTAADRDTYYISAVKERILVVGMKSGAAALDGVLELYGPDGSLVAQNDDGGGGHDPQLVHRADQSGVYRLVVRSFNLASSGEYRLGVNQAANLGGNLALNRPAGASSFSQLASSAPAAVDGDLETAWVPSGTDSQYVYASLPERARADQLVLKWGETAPRSYGVIAWLENQWTVVYWTDQGDGGTDVIPLAALSTPNLGVYIPATATATGLGLREMEVYDSSRVLIPLIPPDPAGKGGESVPGAVPPAPNEAGKGLVFLGGGEQGQENTPLAAPLQAIGPVGLAAGNPVVGMLYPQVSGSIYWPGDALVLQADARVNGTGAFIGAYEWRSDRQGWLGNQSLLVMDSGAMLPGRHVISVRAQDSQGRWSAWASVEIVVSASVFRSYIPAVQR